MAAQRPVTPEKQLLRLIEEQQINPPGLNTRLIKRRGLSLFSPSAWLGRISFLKEAFKKRSRRGRPHSLGVKLLNRILCFFIFILAFYFISNLFSSLVDSRKNLRNLESGTLKSADYAGVGEAAFSKKAASYYFEKIRERDIFKMGHKDSSANQETFQKGPSARIIEATQHLNLVGISWSNDPDAMIEDTRALRTFFVRRGQMIGEVKVQAIFKDKVVLGYDGEEIELK